MIDSRSAEEFAPRARLTADEAAEIVSSYEAGAPVAEIAARHGVHRPTVTKVVTDAGVELRRRKLSEAEIGEASVRYEAGETLKSIGADFGVHGDTVRRALTNAGVDIRAPQRPVKPRRLSAGDVERCRDLRDQGMTWAEIAAEFGVHRETVRRALLRSRG